MKIEVGVIGGGASGLMAAIQAQQQGALVTILEHTQRIGKKILMTGNGKCNFTNESIDDTCYYGCNPKFAMQIIEQFSVKDTLYFFEQNGLLYKEKNGYYYPVSNQASSVLDVLRFAVRRLGICVMTDTTPQEVVPLAEGGFLVKTEAKDYRFDKLIIACGGMAAPKTGSDGSGYKFVKQLGHHMIQPLPALVQLRCNDAGFKSISGIRVDAEIVLFVDGRKVRREVGELQITDYGISGILVFQLSRIVSYALFYGQTVSAEIDVLPQFSEEEVTQFLTGQFRHRAGMTAEEAMQGLLNKKLNLYFLKKSGIAPSQIAAKIADKQLKMLCRIIKHWKVTINGTNDFNQCQVCAGGVDTGELTIACESKLHKGLYFAGEIIDIDGICGGYNLQWAWSSGAVAGRAAAVGEKNDSN